MYGTLFLSINTLIGKNIYMKLLAPKIRLGLSSLDILVILQVN